VSIRADIQRKPEWLRRPPGSAAETLALKKILRRSKLNTVCEEARCPNISECFKRGTATFMILGDICTRGCRFCAVHTGKPVFSAAQFENEAEQVAEAAAGMELRHVVITSVARDDLPDGGASGFVATIHALRRRLPGVGIEVLIPDFRGNEDSLLAVLDAAPDVLNHNLETVPRLYRRVRPGTQYKRSLRLLRLAKSSVPHIRTKTGIMLGLGEEREEVLRVFADARSARVDIFTAGQYLQPTRDHLPVAEYLAPEQFDAYKADAEQLGFAAVFMGPLVRSSYHAEEFAGSGTADSHNLSSSTD
jgi:lipoic acid synthetase